VRLGIGDESRVNDVFEVFKRSLIGVTEEVAGYKVCKGGKKGSAWWTSEIKEAVEDKRSRVSQDHRGKK